MSATTGAFVVKFWPVIAAACAGLVGYGVLTAKVDNLQDNAKSQAMDHDKILEIAGDQKVIRAQLDTIGNKIDRLRYSRQPAAEPDNR